MSSSNSSKLKKSSIASNLTKIIFNKMLSYPIKKVTLNRLQCRYFSKNLFFHHQSIPQIAFSWFKSHRLLIFSRTFNQIRKKSHLKKYLHLGWHKTICWLKVMSYYLRKDRLASSKMITMILISFQSIKLRNILLAKKT